MDDLARCLMDAQQTTRDLRVALTTKEEEVGVCVWKPKEGLHSPPPPPFPRMGVGAVQR